MPFEWVTTPVDAVTAGMSEYERALYQAIYTICLRRKPEIENWMKANAPWTDRTGNARQTLHVDVEATVGAIALYLAHGMHYGIYLETKHAGRYAIVTPAVEHWTPIIMADVRAVLG